MQLHFGEFEAPKEPNGETAEDPKRLRIIPDTPFATTIRVFNDTSEIEAYSVLIATGNKGEEKASPAITVRLGDEPEQTAAVPVFHEVVKLAPDQSMNVPIAMSFPLSHSAGLTLVSVRVKALRENVVQECRTPVWIEAHGDWSLEVGPQVVRSWRSASFDATIVNRGNTKLRFELRDGGNESDIAVRDQESKLRFYILDQNVDKTIRTLEITRNLDEGTAKRVVLRTRLSLRQIQFFGTPYPRVVTTSASPTLISASEKDQEEREDPGGTQTATTTFVQMPLIPPLLVAFLMVVCALGLWSLVLFGGLDRLTGDALEQLEGPPEVLAVDSVCANYPAPDPVERGPLHELRTRLVDGSNIARADTPVFAFSASQPDRVVACAMSGPDGNVVLNVPDGDYFVGPTIGGANTNPTVRVDGTDVQMPKTVATDPAVADPNFSQSATRQLDSGTKVSPFGLLTANDASNLTIEIRWDDPDLTLKGVPEGSYTLHAIVDKATAGEGEIAGSDRDMRAGGAGMGQSDISIVSVPVEIGENGVVAIPRLPRIGNGRGVICGAVTNGTSFMEGAIVTVIGTGTGDDAFTLETRATTQDQTFEQPSADVQLSVDATCAGRANPGFVFGGLPTPATYTVSTLGYDGATISTTVSLSDTTTAEGIILEIGATTFSMMGRVVVPDGEMPDITVTASSGTTTSVSMVQYEGKCEIRPLGPPVEKIVGDSLNAPCFAFYGLPSTARYTVTISAPGYRTATIAVDPPVDDPFGTERVPETVLERIETGMIGGVLISTDGSTLAHPVILRDGPVEVARLSTGEDGGFSFIGLPVPRVYTLAVDETLDDGTRVLADMEVELTELSSSRVVRLVTTPGT